MFKRKKMKTVFYFFAMLFLTAMACAHTHDNPRRSVADSDRLTIVDNLDDEHDDNDAAETFIPSDYLFSIAVGCDDGRQMLIVSETDEDDVFAGIRPDSITTCFHNGRLYPVRYVGKQKRSDESTGRETTQNFRNLGGYVYELISDRLPLTEDEEYMYYVSLSDRKFAGDFSVVEMQHYTARNDEGNIIYDDYALRRMEQTRGDLAKRYGRKIKTVEVVAATSDGEYFVYSVQFENKGTQALGLVAIETPEGYSILEEPAEYNEISTWRADDEGSYYAPYVAGLFRKYDGSLLILLERFGEEGANFEFYVAHEDGKLKRYDRAWYFYAAPL